MKPLSRRSMLRAAGLGSLSAGLASVVRPQGGDSAEERAIASPKAHASHGASAPHHGMGVVGSIDKSLFDPNQFLRAFNFSDLAPAERARYYRESPRPGGAPGSLLREYEFVAIDREIE